MLSSSSSSNRDDAMPETYSIPTAAEAVPPIGATTNASTSTSSTNSSIATSVIVIVNLLLAIPQTSRIGKDDVDWWGNLPRTRKWTQRLQGSTTAADGKRNCAFERRGRKLERRQSWTKRSIEKGSIEHRMEFGQNSPSVSSANIFDGCCGTTSSILVKLRGRAGRRSFGAGQVWYVCMKNGGWKWIRQQWGGGVSMNGRQEVRKSN